MTPWTGNSVNFASHSEMMWQVPVPGRIPSVLTSWDISGAPTQAFFGYLMNDLPLCWSNPLFRLHHLVCSSDSFSSRRLGGPDVHHWQIGKTNPDFFTVFGKQLGDESHRTCEHHDLSVHLIIELDQSLRCGVASCCPPFVGFVGCWFFFTGELRFFIAPDITRDGVSSNVWSVANRNFSIFCRWNL